MHQFGILSQSVWQVKGRLRTRRGVANLHAPSNAALAVEPAKGASRSVEESNLHLRVTNDSRVWLGHAQGGRGPVPRPG